ncbi:MAG: VCBS repeat-containing protein [Ginsengibacter sp.]
MRLKQPVKFFTGGGSVSSAKEWRLGVRLIIIISFIFFGCHTNKEAKTLFTLMPSDQTGVNFTNTVPENDSLHIMNYEYLYNGHGVAAGDFNNDGWDDIFIAGNAVPNKLFINKKNSPAGQAGFHFDDVTSGAGVAGNGTWSTGVCAADVNGDGLMDVYVCHSGKFSDSSKLSNELFINQGLNKESIPVFKNMAKEFGLDAPGTQSTMAVFFDYDKDGDLDMFLLNHSINSYDPFENTSIVRSKTSKEYGNRLFKNLLIETSENKFTDVTQQAGIQSHVYNYGLSVNVSDINMDGWPDIYTTSDYTEKDCYYINNKNGTFTESLENSFTQISKYSMGSDVADINNDAMPDVFTLDMLPEDNYRQKLLKGPDEYDKYHLIVDSGFYYQQMRNMLHLNEGADAKGNERFSEIAQLSGISNTDWSWSALFADMDNDGWKDLFITNGYLRDFTNMDFLKYTAADAMLEEAQKKNFNYKTFDLVKKIPSNKLSNYAFQNSRDLTFKNVTKSWGLDLPVVSNGAAYADFDNDGDLDLIVCNNDDPVSLYRNNSEGVKNSYINLNLKGASKNTEALGAKVFAYTNGNEQFLEKSRVRGFQSTVTSTLHFGLGSATALDSLKIVWPDGTETVRKNVPANQNVTIDESAENNFAKEDGLQKKNKTYYKDITAESNINFIHKENDFIDFKDETLLPWQLSKYGPALAVADINKDGLDDFFAGGAISQASVVYIQNANGTFKKIPQPDIEKDKESEDVSAVFLDANGDSYPDLYVVSGGNEYTDGSPEYQDRLYINDGKGNFAKSLNALPSMLSSKQAVAVGDYDGDGDVDIFVGGKSIPGSFPLPSRSYILRNDSQKGVTKFTDATQEIAPDLLNPGMISAAIWMPVKNSKELQLVIAGDFMPVEIFKYSSGKFVNISKEAGLENTNGLWAALQTDDIDHDGNMDIIAGNCGTNTQYHSSHDKPLTLYYNDFDGNGVIDPLICYYIGDTSYPMASRDEMLDKIQGLKKKFVHYKDYGNATIKDILTDDQLNSSKKLFCNTQQSAVFFNDGNNHFIKKDLPLEAQFSRVSSIERIANNKLLIAGNFYPYRVQLGHSDASMGLILKNNSKEIIAEEPYESGLYLSGDVRNARIMKGSNNKHYLIVAVNNAPLKLYEIPNGN